MADKTTDEALGWDDEATVSDDAYVLLDPGEYVYEVTDFKRQRFNGSAKMPACPMAVLTLSVANSAGDKGRVQARFYLTKRQMWKMTQFFKSCELISPSTPSGTTYRMPWDSVIGATGRVVLSTREYNGRAYNDIDHFVVVDVKAAAKQYGAL